MRRRYWGRVLLRVLTGLVIGYVAYLPAFAIQQYMSYGRIDRERYFYGLYLPFQFPFVLFPDFRDSYTTGEILIQIVGILFMTLGIWLALRARKHGGAVRIRSEAEE